MSSRVQVGLIGFGRMGRIYAEALMQLKDLADFKAIATIPTEEDAKAMAKYPCNIYDTPAQMLEAENLEAVIVCTPTATHTEIIKMAAGRGIHILCEKPLSTDFESGKEAVMAARKAGVKLQIGFNRRFDANSLAMREAMKSGSLGDLRVLRITTHDAPPLNVEYALTAGGLLTDMMIHDYDMARYLSGEEIDTIYATGEGLISDRIKANGDIDVGIAVLGFKSGAMGILDISRLISFGFDYRLEIFASEKLLVSQNRSEANYLEFSPQGVVMPKVYQSWWERFEQSFPTETEYFLKAVRDDGELIVTGEDGLRAMLAADAANESLRTKKPVKVADLVL